MHLFSMEHSQLANRADLGLYGLASAALSIGLMVGTPPEIRVQISALALVGLGAWTLAEYGLHRFVLHGVFPFKDWHAEHHRRPAALISSPTVLSASLFFGLVFLPALALAGPWRACALTLGMISGYLVYGITHHAMHHWHLDNGWFKQRKRWHALHHGSRFGAAPNPGQCAQTGPGHFGVTTSFWDHLFRTGADSRKQAALQRNG